jgi:hypothetical protein
MGAAYRVRPMSSNNEMGERPIFRQNSELNAKFLESSFSGLF